MGRGKTKRTPKSPFEASGRNANDKYEVEAIRSKRRAFGKLQYEVKWLGCSTPDNTFECVENLEGAEEIVAEFERAWQVSYDEKSLQAVAEKRAAIALARDTALDQAQALNQVTVAQAIAGRLERNGMNASLCIRSPSLYDSPPSLLGSNPGSQKSTDSPVSYMFPSPVEKRSKVYKAYHEVVQGGHVVFACSCPHVDDPTQLCSIVPSAKSNTTNMWTHLRTHHTDVYASLKKHGCMPSEVVELDLSPSKPDRPMLKTRTKLNASATDRAHRLGTASIVTGGSPFDSLSQPGVQAWVKYISAESYSSPSYKTVMGHLAILADDGRKDTTIFRRELKRQGVKPAGASDMWSSNGVALLGGTLHGILRQMDGARATDPWTLKHTLSAAAPCGKHRHTADWIRSNYNNALEQIEIRDPIEDMFMDVIDGAANAQKALDDRNKSWCAVHKLQCSVNKYRKHIGVRDSFAKARGLVGHFNHSTVAKNELKSYMAQSGIHPHNLTQDIEVRWSSMLYMCGDLHDSREAICLYDIRSNNPGEAYKSNKLDNDNWAVIEGTIDVLQAAGHATELLEGDAYVTSSLVIPTMYKVVYLADPAHDLVDNDGGPITHSSLDEGVQAAREEYHADLHERWISLIDDQAERFFFIATQLDPRFKSLRAIHGLEEGLKATARGWFRSTFAMLWRKDHVDPMPTAPPLPPADGVAPTDLDAPPMRKSRHKDRVSLASFLGRNPLENARNSFDLDEIDLYLSLPEEPFTTDPLVWWPKHAKQLPDLALMAQQYLAVPASSASVERLFSAAGRDFSKHRQGMNDSTLENLLWARSFLKNNEP